MTSPSERRTEKEGRCSAGYRRVLMAHFRVRHPQDLPAELAHDPRPMPAEMMVAQRAEEMQHHATVTGFSEVGLHGGKPS